MIFLYLVVTGILLNRMFMMEDVHQIISIFYMGYSGENGLKMFEIIISFMFYFMCTSRILGSIDGLNTVYEYVWVRVNSPTYFLRKLFEKVILSTVTIWLEMIMAKLLLMLLAQDFQYTLGDLCRDGILLTTLLWIGIVGIGAFYKNHFSGRLITLISMLMLVCIFSVHKGLKIISLIIPIEQCASMVTVFGLALKTVLMIIVYIYFGKYSKKFERINCHD